MIKNYYDFRFNKESKKDVEKNSFINENIAQAKEFLLGRAKREMEEKKGEKVTLTEQDKRRILSDPNFAKIKELLKDSPNYVNLFTRIFYTDLNQIEEDSEKHSELERLLNTINNNSQHLSSLPMEVNAYATKDAAVKEKENAEKEGRQYRGPFERLMDDLERLGNVRKMNQWVSKLGSTQKQWFKNISDKQKDRLEGIAVAFDQLGSDEKNKAKRDELNKSLTRYFFSKVERYKDLGELLNAAENYIKSAGLSGYGQFIKKVDSVNMQFGLANGAEEVYYEDNILVLEIRSFMANKLLNANTSHCIKDSQHSWDSYVGDDKYNKQYYVYNFNLSITDNQSIIGLTVDQNDRIVACHLKNDGGFISNFSSYCSKWKIPLSIFKGMTQKEVEAKKKRVQANKIIVQQGTSLSQIKQAIENGADPNAKNGLPILNAVQENNKEKVKYLIEVGGNPNINYPILKAVDLDMVKTIIDNGGEISDPKISDDLFTRFCGYPNAPRRGAVIKGDHKLVSYFLYNGMNPNCPISQTGEYLGKPLRRASAFGDVEMCEILIKGGANPSTNGWAALTFAMENGHFELFEKIIQKSKDPKLFYGDDKIDEDELLTEIIDMGKSGTTSNPDRNKAVEIMSRYLDKLSGVYKYWAELFANTEEFSNPFLFIDTILKYNWLDVKAKQIYLNKLDKSISYLISDQSNEIKKSSLKSKFKVGDTIGDLKIVP